MAERSQPVSSQPISRQSIPHQPLSKQSLSSDPALDLPAQAASTSREPKKPAKPYRLFGLCISLVVITILTVATSALLALLAYGLRFGFGHLGEVLSVLAAGGVKGDTNALDLIGADLQASPQAPFVASIILYAGLSFAILTLARWKGGAAWRDMIGWHPWSPATASRSYWWIVAIALAYGIAANILIAHLYPPSKDWFNVPKDHLSSAIVLFALAAVFAPIAEELLFRGWIFTSLRAQFGLFVSLLITSGIFASLHYEKTHIYALAVFPIGLCLGLMRERAGSLKASISFHAFYNALAFCLAALDLA
jgi:membrane protease YdiL (CAAX protease family)